MTKIEKVPILGIFSPKTILMFRVGLKKIRVGRQQESHIYFIYALWKIPFNSLKWFKRYKSDFTNMPQSFSFWIPVNKYF